MARSLRRNVLRQAALRRAQAGASVVRIHRGALERVDGCVLDVGAAFVLVQALGNSLDLEGYEVVRIRDITSVEHSTTRCAFYDRILERRGRVPMPVPGIELEDAAQVLRSVEATFGLVVVARERLSPGACLIGTVSHLSKREYALRNLTPDGEWDDTDRQHYRLGDITKVDFANGYEAALAVMAGVRTTF